MAKPKQVIVNSIQVFNLFVTESKCVNNSVLGYTERKQTISSVGCEGQDCRHVGKTDRLGQNGLAPRPHAHPSSFRTITNRNY